MSGTSTVTFSRYCILLSPAPPSSRRLSHSPPLRVHRRHVGTALTALATASLVFYRSTPCLQWQLSSPSSQPSARYILPGVPPRHMFINADMGIRISSQAHPLAAVPCTVLVVGGPPPGDPLISPACEPRVLWVVRHRLLTLLRNIVELSRSALI